MQKVEDKKITNNIFGEGGESVASVGLTFSSSGKDLRNSRSCNADVCYLYARSHRGVRRAACGNSQSINRRIALRDTVQKFGTDK